jgi:Chaperone of endosialidase
MNPLIHTRAAILPLLIAFALTWLPLSPRAQAVVPPPDGGYPGGNTAEGHNALLSLTTGQHNTAVGFLSLRANTTASLNTAVGSGTLLANTADANTATGAFALLSNTTGFENTAIGAAALLFNTIGASNTAVGATALFYNTAGSDNTGIGLRALENNTTGSGNTASGAGALAFNTTGGGNTANGVTALIFNTTGSDNTANGAGALGLNTTGFNNTATGRGALFNNATGAGNTANGLRALGNNTTGNGNTANGDRALAGNTNGNGNVAIGVFAGSAQTTGSNNVYIGANIPGVAGESDACYIGSIFGRPAAPAVPVQITTGNKLGTTASSKRFKEAIKPMDKASEALLALKPVAFRYKKEIDVAGTSQFGLVAEDVEKVNPDLVVHDKEGRPYSVRYDQVNAMLLNEFLKEHRKNEQQRKDFEAAIARQQKQIEVLTEGLQKVSAQLEASKPAPQQVALKVR